MFKILETLCAILYYIYLHKNKTKKSAIDINKLRILIVHRRKIKLGFIKFKITKVVIF